MKKSLASLGVVILTIAMGSTGLASNDDGGGGGGVYTKRNSGEMEQLLRDYQARRQALRHSHTTAGTVALTTEEEMQYLHEEAFRAQVARRQAASASPTE